MKVKFSDVVRRANTKEDRFNTDKEFYVGGEHMITGEYLITRRGTIAGSNIGPMFYFGFKKGQVLLASRSPDLKKAGMVTFDGICSEKTFVIETKDESVLLQDFLPAIVRSESFWKYANDNQSGSVNHFINWTTFANYEFDLPDIETQRKLSTLLWAMERTKTAYTNLIAKTDELVKSQFVEMFGTVKNNEKGWPLMPMKEAATRLSDGPFGSNLKSEHYCPEGVRVIRLQNICDGYFLDDDKAYVGWDHYEKIKKYTCHAGDVVIGTLGEPNLRACLIPDNIEIAINKADCVHYIPRPELLDKRFVCAFINSPATLEMAIGDIHGNTRQRISSGQLAKLPIMIPPMELQEEYASFIEQADKSKYVARQATSNLKTYGIL